uniref:Sodefrin-like factor n=1 Tax=Leptobrachium leishanense TaxID=445787 RepID=A0A8C5QTW8_9ANUR
MSFAVGILCTFSALIASGYALSCTECMVLGSKVCEGSTITCAVNHTCGLQYTVSHLDGVQEKETFIRHCVPKNLCGLEATNTYGNNIQALSGISCCFTENCLPPKPRLPLLSTKKNGLTCQTCLSLKSDSCAGDETIECNGNEDMCFLSSTKTAAPLSVESSYRGCTTKNLCDLDEFSLSVHGITMDTKVICSNGSPGLYNGFILPLLVVLLLGKMCS